MISKQIVSKMSETMHKWRTPHLNLDMLIKTVQVILLNSSKILMEARDHRTNTLVYSMWLVEDSVEIFVNYDQVFR